MISPWPRDFTSLLSLRMAHFFMYKVVLPFSYFGGFHWTSHTRHSHSEAEQSGLSRWKSCERLMVYKILGGLDPRGPDGSGAGLR